ncbi:MAG: hypothetical protein HPY62_08030 [Bacteroidales bacterium]|nr:hypothetical protein [Bacteroidales bacterium]
MNLVSDIRDKMMKDNLVFVYRGVVTEDNSVGLLTLLEKEMDNSEFGFTGRKRLFMFVLESLQNVSKHSEREMYGQMSLVLYSGHNNGYTVTTGNVVTLSQARELQKRLSEINSLAPDQVKGYYRQMLVNSEFTKKGGAGLGLIEMARKTGNKIDYDFIPFDKHHAYFVLSKTVDEEGKGIHKDNPDSQFSGQVAFELENIMAEKGIYLIWSGHITTTVGHEVISFAETRMAEEEIRGNLRRKIFVTLVEMLENVAKYGADRESEKKFGMPVAMVQLVSENSFTLSTGNLILNKHVDPLKEKLALINQNDLKGLRELFKATLFEQKTDTDSTEKMGLIEMAIKSGSKLVYEFIKINDQFSYFTLKVNLSDCQG